jgi:CubicO group peptidase (beta-lactamase class C family)
MDMHTPTRREFLAGMAVAPMALAGADPWQNLVAFVDGEVAAGTFPGAAVIASRGGRVRFQKQCGTYCALTRRAAPVTADVIHPLFSYSKLVSATVVVMAHADGLVDYDVPVSAYIPEFVGGGKDRITLRHALTHSAGIPNVPLGPAGTEDEWRAGVAALCAAKTEWEPGSRTAYHGLSGMFVAAEVVRRRAGSPSWDALCRGRLFGPIGAATLTFSLPPDSAPVALTPQPKDIPASLRAAFGMAGHPAGGCLGTPADSLKVLQLHLNRGTWRGKRLIPEAALDEMHTVQYRREIEKARAEWRTPTHETWGLGPLLRGTGQQPGAYDWFGFRDQASPGVFGHAGIDTVTGVADMATGKALMFVTTDSPKPPEKTVVVRNGVTDRVFAALG